MVGSKHKNGIICTFPNCNKPMRTQKFKMHFTKTHLKEGEEYSVAHRRQYEVAREGSNARSAVKEELVPVMSDAEAIAEAAPTTVQEIARVGAVNAHMAARGDVQIHTAQARQPVTAAQSQQVPLQSSYEEAQIMHEAKSSDCVAGGTVQITSTPAQTMLPSVQTSGSKRPAAAMGASADTVDPTSVLLMQFIALMDQRFQELVGKMGEMIDVQKDLIDTLQASNPSGEAPASAFSHAVEVVMKKRKTDLSPRDNNVNADSNGSAEADGGNQGGFAL
jgi:hypothetical protein